MPARHRGSVTPRRPGTRGPRCAPAWMPGANTSRLPADRPPLMRRVAVIGAGTLDSLPHNGAVVTLLALRGLTHSESYFDIVMVAIVRRDPRTRRRDPARHGVRLVPAPRASRLDDDRLTSHHAAAA